MEAATIKQVVVDSLEFLVKNKKVRVYGFVIMANHIHLIWRNLEMNGKEHPDESFLKFTAHQFKKHLKKSGAPLDQYHVDKTDRTYQFWQRSPLAVEITSKQMLEQKLNYVHLNPLQDHWNLVVDPNDYFYSSCSFYERNKSIFEWLTDYREDFD